MAVSVGEFKSLEHAINKQTAEIYIYGVARKKGEYDV